MRNQRIVIVAIIALALGAVAVAAAAYRQEQTDARLIAAIIRCDAPTALKCIRDGADPNSQVEDNPPRGAPAILLRYLERSLAERRSHAAEGDRSALGTALLAEAMSPQPDRDRQAYDDIAAALVARGADCNARLVVSNAPLAVATRLRLNETVKAMLDRGSDPNGGRGVGPTPLMGADLDSTALLLQHKADVNARDPNGETPLMYACRRPQGAPEIVRRLLRAGADPNVADRRGNRALMLSRNLDVVTQLIASGADINARNADGYTALGYRLADAAIDPDEMQPIAAYLEQHGGHK